MNDWGEIKTDWNNKDDIKKENVKRDHHYAAIGYQHTTKHLYRRAYSELTTKTYYKTYHKNIQQNIQIGRAHV